MKDGGKRPAARQTQREALRQRLAEKRAIDSPCVCYERELQRIALRQLFTLAILQYVAKFNKRFWVKAMFITPFDPVPRKVDNKLHIELSTIHHTYGDPVRGTIHLQNVRKVFLESLDLKFGGECGTNIRCPVKRTVWTKFGPTEQVYYKKAAEKKILFEDSRVIATGLHLEPGHHKWPYEFHFPEREEVDLAPNAEPFAVADYFWFRYELLGAAALIDSNHTKVTLRALRYPSFLDSRRASSVGPPISSELALSRRPSVTQRLPNRVRRTSTAVENIRLALNTPSLIVTNEPLPVTLTVVEAINEVSAVDAPSACQRWRLVKFKMGLKYKIRLTAEGRTVPVDLGKAETVKTCEYSAKKNTDAPDFSSNETFEVGQKLGIKTPKGIRPTFRNDLVHFEHCFKVTLELERDGRVYLAKFTDIAVDVEPSYIQESLPAFDDAIDHPPPPFTASAEQASESGPTTTAGLVIAPSAPSRSRSLTPPRTPDPRASDLEDEVYEPIRRASWSPL